MRDDAVTHGREGTHRPLAAPPVRRSGRRPLVRLRLSVSVAGASHVLGPGLPVLRPDARFAPARLHRVAHVPVAPALFTTLSDSAPVMLCFALEDMTHLKEYDVEDDAACGRAGGEVLRRAEHAQEHGVPQLWVVGGDGRGDELVGNHERLNEELDSGRFIERLQRAGIPHLSLEVDPEMGW